MQTEHTDRTHWTDLAITINGDMILESDKGDLLVVTPIRWFQWIDGFQWIEGSPVKAVETN